MSKSKARQQLQQHLSWNLLAGLSTGWKLSSGNFFRRFSFVTVLYCLRSLQLVLRFLAIPVSTKSEDNVKEDETWTYRMA
jgi:hypothetical protein